MTEPTVHPNTQGLRELKERIADIDEWLIDGERGDPNGAKCYQARKLVGDLSRALESALGERQPQTLQGSAPLEPANALEGRELQSLRNTTQAAPAAPNERLRGLAEQIITDYGRANHATLESTRLWDLHVTKVTQLLADHEAQQAERIAELEKALRECDRVEDRLLRFNSSACSEEGCIADKACAVVCVTDLKKLQQVNLEARAALNRPAPDQKGERDA